MRPDWFRPASLRTPARVLALPLFLAALFLLVLAIAPARAAGGDLVWTFFGIEDVNCAAEVDDRDGDGVPDLAVETYDAGASGDHFFLLSGGAPGPLASVIWSVRPLGGPSNSGGWGDECVRPAPDLDGDGQSDVLLATAWGGRTAYALNGDDGSTIWSFDTYADSPPSPPTSGWVYTMCAIPDLDGDGVANVAFGCGSDNDRVYHVNGRTGALFYSLDLGDAIFSSAALGDVSADGIGDFAIGVGETAEAVYVFKGGAQATPTLWSNPMPGSVQALARIPDVSGDGLDDVVAGHWGGSIDAFSGADGSPIWSTPFASPVMELVVAGDVDGGGVPDLVVGSWSSSAHLVSSETGTILWAFLTGDDVWAVGATADLTGDGVEDVVAGSFDGRVYLVDGMAGTEVWRFPTGNRLYEVIGTSDLTGNGAADVFAGTQFLSGSGGRGYLLEGGAGAVSADLPLVTARSTGAGIELSLAGAGAWKRARVERAEGAPNGPEAVAAFRAGLVAAYREGLLSAGEAIAARSQDPQMRFTALGGELDVVGGSAAFVDGTAEAGGTYTYRFAFLLDGQVAAYSEPATVTHSGAGAGRPAIPPVVASPNPTGGPVAIEFRIPRPQAWTLSAYDAAGRRVAAIAGSPGSSGDVRTEWDASRVPAGVYFLKLEARDFVSTTKVTRLR